MAKKSNSSKQSSARPRATIGVIGGSGLYAMQGLSDAREVRIKTPFGDPSDAFVIGTVEGKRVAFLALDAHGRVGAACTARTGFQYAVARPGKVELLKAREIGVEEK